MNRISHQNCKNDYSSYELFGFDIILDQEFKPWILEVNITPSLKSESDVDKNVKYKVIRDMFNLVGYNLPPLAPEEQARLAGFSDCKLFFDRELYTESLSRRDKMKQQKFQELFKMIEMTEMSILNNLTQSDIRVLMLSEDELSRCGQFKRVFPSTSDKYLKLFDKPRYYNLLLHAFEKLYKDNRIEGINHISKLADIQS